MNKTVKLLSTLFVLFATSPVMAQSNDTITDLQAEIGELEITLNELKTELRALQASEEGMYTIETNSATYTFSNPRVEGDLLLLDLDFTNDTKGRLDVYNDIWSLAFSQEDNTSINPLWLSNETLPEVEGRRPLTYNIRIKTGATVKLLIGLSKTSDVYFAEPYVEMPPTEEPATEEEPQETVTFDDLSPL